MAPPSIDVLQCTASELANYLNEHRFEDDGAATTTFLLEGMSTLPNAEAIAAQLHGATEGGEEEDPALVSGESEESEAQPSQSTLGKAHHSTPLELSLTNPRGKFHVTLHEQGIHAQTVKNPQQLIIPAGAARCAIVFPKHSDCLTTSKKATDPPPSPMMLLCFHDNTDNDENNSHPTVTFKDKPLTQICFPIPANLDGLNYDNDDNSSNTSPNVVESWIQKVCDSLEMDAATDIYRIRNPAYDAPLAKKWGFKSHQEPGKSTTSDGMPFVKCYHGVQDGCLYPMEEGLFFFKPPLFVPRSNLHSIACGRGTGASRYVDMQIVTHDESNLEFTNISREETAVLNDYIHKVLIPAMQRDNDGNSSAAMEVDGEDAVEVEVEADDDDDDTEDSDSIEIVHVKEGRGCRSKRRAAREAIQTTKQHYQQGAVEEEENDDDSDEDANFQFQPDNDDEEEGDDGSVEEEEDDFEPEGNEGDDDNSDDDDEEEEEDSDGDAVEVVVDDDTEDEAEVEEISKPPPKKQRK